MSLNTIIPDLFLCPITHNIMTNPHIDNDGNTYEYDAIMQWLQNNNSLSITRNYLHYSYLKPNCSLLELITNFNSNNNIQLSLLNIENNFSIHQNAISLFIDKYIVDINKDNKTNLIKLDFGTLITPWHPVLNNNNEWIFPFTIGKLINEY